MLAYREYYVLEDAETVEQGAALEQKAEMGPHLVQILFAEVVDSAAVEIDFAGRGPEQNDEVLYENGLSASARSYYDGRLALLYRERDIIQHEMRTEPLRYVLDRKDAVRPLGGAILLLLSCQVLSIQDNVITLRGS